MHRLTEERLKYTKSNGKFDEKKFVQDYGFTCAFCNQKVRVIIELGQKFVQVCFKCLGR